jgi:hypothetical protein
VSEAPDRRRLAIVAGRLADLCLTLLSSIATLSLAAYAVALITGRAW